MSGHGAQTDELNQGAAAYFGGDAEHEPLGFRPCKVA